MPKDKLGSAIKRRSCRETAISRALPNGHSFRGGTEVKSPLLQRRVSSEPDFLLWSLSGRSQRLAQLPEVPALNRLREIAIVTTILVEPIDLP